MDGHRDEESTGVSQVLKATHPLASPSSPCSKRSRRSVQKRAVSIAIADGDAFPPSDSWAWRKYGQKPIKGSPYPRGYYRCSSCKGCPARKQVERSRLDPTTLVVTYSADHNHPWPLPKNGRHHQNRSPPAAPPTVEEPKPRPPPSQPTVEHEKYPEVTGEEDKPLLMIDEDGDSFRWFSDLASPSPTSAGSDELLLYSSILFGSADAAAGLAPEEREEAATVADGEEDSMFAGLGELPEYSVVLRRDLAPASWMGTAG